MQAGIKGAYDCVKAFSETDLTEDLKRFDIPTWIVHGSDDQIVPIVAAGEKSSKIVKGAKFTVYEGAPHGLSMVAPSRTRSTPTCWPSFAVDRRAGGGRSRVGPAPGAPRSVPVALAPDQEGRPIQPSCTASGNMPRCRRLCRWSCQSPLRCGRR